MKKILHILDNIEKYFSAAALAVMLVIVFWQVVFRYVFNSANSWSEELARYLHVFLVYIACGYATRMREHIKIDALIFVFPKIIRPFIVRLGEAVFLAFCIVIVVFGIRQSLSVFNMGRISSALKISMGYIYIILPVGYSLTSIRIIQNWIIDAAEYLKDRKLGKKGGEA
ncbi:MAG: TRAP transporter small permease [Oscillospiraceae bacterium]|nr:TRAP transporter small permease [Oscillospiraceae bacterium]